MEVLKRSKLRNILNYEQFQELFDNLTPLDQHKRDATWDNMVKTRYYAYEKNDTEKKREDWWN